jgi:hypothetical protein
VPPKPRPVADVLAELAEELSRGKVYEGALLSKGQITYGMCDYNTGAVHVDPVPYVVETLCHELLHRRYPSWSECRPGSVPARVGHDAPAVADVVSPL